MFFDDEYDLEPIGSFIAFTACLALTALVGYLGVTSSIPAVSVFLYLVAAALLVFTAAVFSDIMLLLFFVAVAIALICAIGARFGMFA